MINRYWIEVSQSELAIAHFLGDGELWVRAMRRMRDAVGTPWYTRHQ